MQDPAKGNWVYTVNAGRMVGAERATGLPTGIYTVVTNSNGHLKTCLSWDNVIMPVLIVRLRGETPEEVIAEGGDDTGALARLLPTLDRDTYHHLPYIDPWGLTVFNQVQMKVVIPELERLRAQPASVKLVDVLNRIIEMAERCRDDVHLYLEFEGD